MDHSTFNFKKSILYVFIATFFALAISGWLGEYLEVKGIVVGLYRYLLQAFIMSGIVISGIVWVRKNADHHYPIDIGLAKPIQALIRFLVGAGLVVIPMLLTLSISLSLNWTEISLNLNSTIGWSFLIGFINVIFYEAIPEELAFRGYIFGALRSAKGVWASAIITILLFVLLPLILTPMQKYLLGMDTFIGSENMNYVRYIITMTIFGSFVMFLRVLSGSIWMSVGFHCFFVFVDRIIGLSSKSIIQITDATNGQAMQITLISCYIIMMALVIGKSYMDKRKVKMQLATQSSY